MLAAVNLGIGAKRLLHIAAGFFHHVAGVEPVLQVSAAQLVLFVLLVAGTLPGLLHFDFVFGKLGKVRGLTRFCIRLRGCQGRVPRNNDLVTAILLEKSARKEASCCMRLENFSHSLRRHSAADDRTAPRTRANKPGANSQSVKASIWRAKSGP
jgi:hypothetical protein